MMGFLMMALAVDGGTEQLVDRMQAFYEKTTDFTAEFKQEYTYKAFKRTNVQTGKITYKRSDKGPKMRWDYEKPDPKSFVLAEDKVRLLDPQALTYTISAMDTDKLSASVTFLWGQGKLANEFNITQKACEKCTGVLLVLDSKRPDPRFKQVRLEVDPKTSTVIKSTVIDPDGSENVITFINLKAGAGVTDDAFKMKVTKDYQTIDMTAAAAPKDAGR